MPTTRFPFSNGCCRYRVALRLLRRCCGSIRCGIKSGAILAFRNWPQKRNREREEILAELTALLRDSHTAFAPLPHGYRATGKHLNKGGLATQRVANGSRPVMERSSRCPRHVR